MIVSEASRATIRIGANYTRIVTAIVLSLALVPLLLRVTGSEGWALIAFLGSTIGIPAMVQNITGQSMIRELELHIGGFHCRIQTVLLILEKF